MEPEREPLELAVLASWLGIGRHGVLVCRSAWVDSYYKGGLVFLASFAIVITGYVYGLAAAGWLAALAPWLAWLLGSGLILIACGQVTEIRATVDGLSLRRGRHRARIAWDDLQPISRKIDNGIVYLRLTGAGQVFWLGVTDRATLRLAQTLRRVEAARRRGMQPPTLPPPAEEAISLHTDPPRPGPRSLIRVGRPRQD